MAEFGSPPPGPGPNEPPPVDHGARLGGMPTGAEAKGFFRMLFDFNFTSFVTTKILRFIYILTVVLYSIAALVFLVGGLAQGGFAAVFAVFIVPVAWVIYVAVARVFLEILYVVFQAFARIAAEGR